MTRTLIPTPPDSPDQEQKVLDEKIQHEIKNGFERLEKKLDEIIEILKVIAGRPI